MRQMCSKKVRYLKKEFPNRDFPKVAADLFVREAQFRSYANSLDQTVHHYNKYVSVIIGNIITGLLDQVEDGD